jgi:hypothetical protein
LTEELTPGIAPGYIPDAELAQVAIAGCTRMNEILPEIRELRRRFLSPTRTSPIEGCDTWYQFCREKLHRTPNHIRKALAAERKIKADAAPQPFDRVWEKVKLLVPYTGDGSEHKFVSNMDTMLKTDITQEADVQTAKLILASLRAAIRNFTVYAEQLEEQIRHAGVAQ